MAKAKNTTASRPVTAKEFSSKALKAEQGRRRNNKGRDTNVQAQSWALAKLSGADIESVLAGETVEVACKNRDLVVSLKG